MFGNLEVCDSTSIQFYRVQFHGAFDHCVFVIFVPIYQANLEDRNTGCMFRPGLEKGGLQRVVASKLLLALAKGTPKLRAQVVVRAFGTFFSEIAEDQSQGRRMALCRADAFSTGQCGARGKCKSLTRDRQRGLLQHQLMRS